MNTEPTTLQGGAMHKLSFFSLFTRGFISNNCSLIPILLILLLATATILTLVVVPAVATEGVTTKRDQAEVRRFCSKVASLVRNSSIRKYYLPSEQMETPHELNYPHLDIDGDGTADKVTVGSGSAESLLHIEFSTGGVLDENAGLMVLLKLENTIYVLVTSRYRPADGAPVEHRGLYQPSKRGLIPVCELLAN